MNTFSRTTLLVLVLSLLAQCDRYEFPKPPYPTVATNAVTNISASGATLQGAILEVNDEPIIDHGFVWSFSDFNTIASFKGSLGATEGAGPFSFDLTAGLFADSTYYVKAYVSTKTYTTYGTVVSFRSQGSNAPHIESFSPSEGTGGDTVVIKGNYFTAVTKYVRVKFGSFDAQVVRSDEHTVVCIVPKDIPDPTAAITVAVTDKTGTSPTPFKLRFLALDSFSPTVGTFGDVITLQGGNFNTDPSKNIVTFGDKVATVVEGTATTLKVIVPNSVQTKENKLTVISGVQKSAFTESFTITAPIISALSTVSDYTGAIVEITGDNFNPDKTGDRVRVLSQKTVGSYREVEVVSATRTTLSFRLPSDLGYRSFKVELKVAEQSAFSQQTFTLKDAWLLIGVVAESDLRYGVTGFTLNGKGYQGLGNPNNEKQFSEFDAATHSWNQIATIPGIPRTGPVSFAVGNLGYVGLGGDRDFYAYSPQTGSWTSVATFPQLPAVPGTPPIPAGASAGGKGYVATFTAHDNFLEYDPQTDAWTKKAELPASGSSGWMFTIQDQLYVVLPTKLFQFDAANNAWIEKTGTSISAAYTIGYTLNDKGYIRGPENIYEYNPTTDSWRIIPDNKHAPSGPIPFVIDGRLYLGSTMQGDLWEYDPAFE